MASVTNNDIKKEFEMFGEIFKFYKKYYIPEIDDDDENGKPKPDSYWSCCLSENEQIRRKYEDIPLCKGLMNAIVLELNRRATEKRGENHAST